MKLDRTLRFGLWIQRHLHGLILVWSLLTQACLAGTYLLVLDHHILLALLPLVACSFSIWLVTVVLVVLSDKYNSTIKPLTDAIDPKMMQELTNMLNYVQTDMHAGRVDDTGKT